MALLIKNLYAVFNMTASSDTTVYAPPAGRSALIKNIILVNKSGGTVNVHLRLRQSSGSIYFLVPYNGLPVGANTRLVLSEEITMSYVNGTGDALQMWASSFGAIDAIVNGIERDI